jgi:hypothetical protein
MNRFAQWDQKYVWHPFTQMRDWLRREPVVIVAGRGAELRDARGRKFLDANASIWTNLHGHRHPKINAAISRQLKKIAHSSALGLANEPASMLARNLVAAANPPAPIFHPRLSKVFFSDDGSTALEVALKLAYEFTRRERKISQPKFLSLATRWVRCRWATSNCFTPPTADCCFPATRSWRRTAIGARSIAPGQSGPMHAPTAVATGNASARWRKNSSPAGKSAVPTPPSSWNR